MSDNIRVETNAKLTVAEAVYDDRVVLGATDADNPDDRANQSPRGG